MDLVEVVCVQLVRTLDAIHDEQLRLLSHKTACCINPEAQTASKVLEDTQADFQTVVHTILDNPDELLHVALYEWMMSKNMTNDLIQIDKPSLEPFLLHTLQQSNENIAVMDILWEYYEVHGYHAQAAQVLAIMSCKKESSLTLENRLEYLALAVLNLRKVRHGYAPYVDVILQDLEDKLDVAKVQKQILEAATLLVGIHPKAATTVVALNSGLYRISQLYESFAEPLQLWECQLAIIDCAEYTDPNLVENIWKHIFNKELAKTYINQPNEVVSTVLAKIEILAQTYRSSAYSFPLEYIVKYLEVISAGLKADKSLVPKGLLKMNIPFLDLLDMYNKVFMSSISVHFWKQDETQFHFPETIAALITAFLDNQEFSGIAEKRKIITQCRRSVATVLSNLYDKPNADQLVNILRGILLRLCNCSL